MRGGINGVRWLDFHFTDFPFVYAKDSIEILQNVLEDEVNYFNAEAYPAGREFYYKIAENWVPEVLRRPVRAAIKALSPVGAALHKRKMRKVMR